MIIEPAQVPAAGAELMEVGDGHHHPWRPPGLPCVRRAGGVLRELIVAGTHEGLAAAKARGRLGGRPTVATPDIIKAARDLLPDPDRSLTSIARSRDGTTSVSPTARKAWQASSSGRSALLPDWASDPGAGADAAGRPVLRPFTPR